MSDDPPDRAIYHITHVRSLPDMLGSNALLCESEVLRRRVAYTDIGMPNIKARRRRTPVDCGPGGTPCDYVPFYFAPRSPMLYSIDRGNVPTYQDGQDSVVHLVAMLSAVRATGRPAVFSEGNAGAAFVKFHDDNPSLLERLIDWEIMKLQYWRSTPDDPYRADRRQAEFLVHGHLPFDVIHTVGVCAEYRANEVREIVNRLEYPPKVIVRKDWYY